MSKQPRRRRRQQIIVEEIQELHDVEDDGAIEQSFDEQEERKGTRENIQKSERKVQRKHTHVRQTQKLLLVSTIAVLIVVISVLAFSTLNASNPVKKYSAAQELMAKGKYDKAADKFESLGSYEDATALTMYCKACVLCESGNYEAGVAAFKTLGDFKDSTYRITYYTARAYEDVAGSDYWEYMSQAQSMYNTIPVFLDSAERISALNKRIEKAKTNQYDAAVKAGENGNYFDALNGFDRLGNYKDSEERYVYYQIRESEDALGDSADQDKVIAVAGKYTNMGAYLDCAERENALINKSNKIVADKYAWIVTEIAEGKYAGAEEILNSFGAYGNDKVTEYYYIVAEKYLAVGMWDKASTAFRKAETYSDAAERINEPYYKQAETLLAEYKWEEASAAFKKAGLYSDAAERINEPYYKQTEYFMNHNRYVEAYEAFSKIKGYWDSTEKAQMIYDTYWQDVLKNANVGEYVLLGSYEQDGVVNNGKESIEWLVLEKKNNELLLISRYKLDSLKYHNYRVDITWENCSLRKWLNNDFLNTSFLDIEQAIIQTTTITMDKNPKFDVNPGNSTQDRVFLLNIAEVEKYFVSNDAMNCASTRYAGGRTNVSSLGSSWWWLRSPGIEQDHAACVYSSRSEGIYSRGNPVDDDCEGVRPALWINLDNLVD